jgi:hypothetical protein
LDKAIADFSREAKLLTEVGAEYLTDPPTLSQARVAAGWTMTTP